MQCCSRLIGWFIGRFVDRLNDWLVDWLLIDWLIDLLVVWLIDWLVDCRTLRPQVSHRIVPRRWFTGKFCSNWTTYWAIWNRTWPSSRFPWRSCRPSANGSACLNGASYRNWPRIRSLPPLLPPLPPPPPLWTEEPWPRPRRHRPPTINRSRWSGITR